MLVSFSVKSHSDGGRRKPLRPPGESVPAWYAGSDEPSSGQLQVRLEPAALVAAAPTPRIAEPERGQQVQRGRLRAAIRGGDPDQDVVRPGLGILDEARRSSGPRRRRPVSANSNSGSCRPRRAFSATQSLIGKAGLRIRYMARIEECVGVESR